jgi:exonuclease VII large subunit
LKRGYAIVSQGKEHLSSIKNIRKGDKLNIQLSDGKISSRVEEILL